MVGSPGMDTASTSTPGPPRTLLNSSVNLAAPGTSRIVKLPSGSVAFATTNGRDILKTICVVICALATNPPTAIASKIRIANLPASGLIRSPCALRVNSAREDISHPPLCPQQKSRLTRAEPRRPRAATARPAHAQCYARRVGIKDQAQQERARAGLCADCVHARRIESDRGAIFYLCELSAVDPAYRKYPALPVISCPGYQAKS